MAKGQDIAAQAAKIVGDVRKGIFAPVYLLMGEEPYYPDLVCDAIIENAVDESVRDFNQTIFYALDTDAGTVSSVARSYPMMADRRLVVLKEAQSLKDTEALELYCLDPMETTVLVILMHGASADKRRALYKNASKCGVVLDSPALRDYEIERWISDYYKSRGLDISPDAAAMLGEFAGTGLGRIVSETDKLVKNLPEGVRKVSAADIEKNVGISREFSVFELTKALSVHDAGRALRIAAFVGAGPKFAMPMAVSVLYNHFYRILKYEALLKKTPYPSPSDKAAVLSVNPRFYWEYDAAVRNYPLRKCMTVMNLLLEYDFKGKGGFAGEATPSELLSELTAKILNL